MDDSPDTTDLPAEGQFADGPLVRWRAVWNGALVGLGLLVALSVIDALLDRGLDDFEDSGWVYPLFVGILVAYGVAGAVAARGHPESSLTNGTLAGIGAFVMWVPVRIVIWLVRDEDKGLFTGRAPVLRPGQLFGHIVIAAALGMLGGFIGSRIAARNRSTQ